MLESEYERSRRVLPYRLRPSSSKEVFEYRLRAATVRDLPEIQAIYQHYVTNTGVTLSDSPWNLHQWRRKFAQSEELSLPIIVAESKSRNEIIGFAMAQAREGRGSYRYAAESMIYLRPAATGKGLGVVLLTALIDACIDRKLKRLVAIISDHGAAASLRLHENLGFVQLGHQSKIAFCFGRWLGAYYLEKKLSPRSRSKNHSFN